MIRLDVITVWPGAEGYALGYALESERANYLPAFLNNLLFPLGESIDATTDAVFLPPRLFSALCVLLTGFFTWRYGKQLLGAGATQLGLLCVGASLYLPFFGKVATADALSLLGLSGFVWTGLLYLLGDRKKLLLPAAVFFMLAAIANPSAALVVGVSAVLVTLLGGFGKAKTPLAILPALALLTLFSFPSNRLLYNTLGADAGAMARYSLIGSAPVIGWLLGGIRDLVFRLRKGDRSARVYAGGALVGLLSGSLLFPLFLGLIAGKQMQLYFREARYPWKDWVRAGSVLHLIAAFGVVVVVLAGGGIAFPGAGFRAALGMAAAYWIFSLFGVIGNFGDQRDFALGGALLAGYLSVMFFWVQVYPYLEYDRAWPERLIPELRKNDVATVAITDDQAATAIPYLLRAGVEVRSSGVEGFGLLGVASAQDTTTGFLLSTEGRALLTRKRFGYRVLE